MKPLPGKKDGLNLRIRYEIVSSWAGCMLTVLWHGQGGCIHAHERGGGGEVGVTGVDAVCDHCPKLSIGGPLIETCLLYMTLLGSVAIIFAMPCARETFQSKGFSACLM